MFLKKKTNNVRYADPIPSLTFLYRPFTLFFEIFVKRGALFANKFSFWERTWVGIKDRQVLDLLDR